MTKDCRVSLLEHSASPAVEPVNDYTMRHLGTLGSAALLAAGSFHQHAGFQGRVESVHNSSEPSPQCPGLVRKSIQGLRHERVRRAAQLKKVGRFLPRGCRLRQLNPEQEQEVPF